MDELRKQSPEDVVDRLARFTLANRHGTYVTRPAALDGVTASIDSEPGDKTQAALELPCSDEVTLDDTLSALLLVPYERRHLDRVERELIEAAMDRGATWEQVGSFYRGNSPGDSVGPPKGVSKQSMQRRYRRLGGRRTWPTRRPAADLPSEQDTGSDQ